MLHSLRLLLFGLSITVALSACGGGGSDQAPPPPPPPNPLFVRTSGNDRNSGADPANALRHVSKAAQIARSGYTIIVGPGTYQEGVTTTPVGVTPQALTFMADVSGAQTGAGPGPVVIDASGSGAAAALSLFNTPGTVIDGFTITGGSDAGIVIKSGSNDLRIRNCVVFGNNGSPGDGIRIQDSANVLIFNNLIYGNSGVGIVIAGTVSGSPDAHLVSNTVASNGQRGLTIGNTQRPSPRAFLRNNIFQDNGGDESIKVFTTPRSDEGYDGDVNLVRPARYLPADIAGRHDISADARFVSPAGNDYRLRANSPAIDAGDSLNSSRELADFLRGRTTTGGTDCDKGPLDLGYHFPVSGRCTAVVP